jgi:hypothetical protein
MAQKKRRRATLFERLATFATRAAQSVSADYEKKERGWHEICK